MRESARGGLLGIMIVFVLCLIALAYLYQHSLSRCLTRREVALRLRYRHLCERAESLEIEVRKLTSFARLDSVWNAAGRPEPATGLAVRADTSQPMELAGRIERSGRGR